MSRGQGIILDLRLLSQAVQSLARTEEENRADWIKAAAQAFYIGQFYTGLESCLEKALKLKQIEPPAASDRYHLELVALAEELDLIPDSHIELISDLRGFRHFIRHAYGILLREEEIAKKAAMIVSAWPKLRTYLENKLGIGT